MATESQLVTEKLGTLIENASNIYKELESEIKITNDPFFKDLVCPKNWQDHPFDRWFKLKEGYSSMMVKSLLEEFKARPTDWVVDPFNGSGSTLVGARNANINGLGFEVNPFLAKLASVKLSPYDDATKLKSSVEQLFQGIYENRARKTVIPKLRITEKLFREQLDLLLSIKAEINSVDDDITRDFLLIGLGCILERVSYAKKDGNGLKYPKRRKPLPLIETLREQYQLMIEDVEQSQFKAKEYPKYCIINEDSRNINLSKLLKSYPDMHQDLKENLRISIFSPPYCNCFDYTEVYKIELWMLDFIKDYKELKTLRKNSLSSHLNKTYTAPGSAVLEELETVADSIPWELTWGKQKMKHMVLNYFEDMKKVFLKLDGLLNDEGILVCVVGNSAYGNVPIATDVFLARMLQDMGYPDIEIRVARTLTTSSQQQKYLRGNPYLRESLVIAKK
ncbi:MAG: DNA methyltransferase [Candidatus Hodarchaeota archaeon]